MSGVFGCWQIVVLANIQPTFSLYLRDIEIGYFQPAMLQYIVLNLRVDCPILELRHINPNLFRVDLALGKQDNRLHMRRPREQIHRLGLHRPIAKGLQPVHVPGQGGRVTGDIDDAIRLHCCLLYTAEPDH